MSGAINGKKRNRKLFYPSDHSKRYYNVRFFLSSLDTANVVNYFIGIKLVSKGILNKYFLKLLMMLLKSSEVTQRTEKNYHFSLKLGSQRQKLILTHSWWRSLSHRNQSIDLQTKSMDSFLYNRDLRRERFNVCSSFIRVSLNKLAFSLTYIN